MGLSTALSEIALVLFTSLAPSGAVALALMALVLLALPLDHPFRDTLNRWFWVPLTVAMVGLVASAVHLGDPSNALYVLVGVGRSPLSNEVFSAVCFLALCGLYWLYSFALKPRRQIQRIWLVFILVLAVVFVLTVGLAYSAETIPTWNNAYTPMNVILSAFTAGPLLALFTFFGAWVRDNRVYFSRRFSAGLMALSSCAFVGNVVCSVLLGRDLPSLGNSLVSATELVPHYWPMLAASVFLVLVALACASYVHLYKVPRVMAEKETLTTQVVVLSGGAYLFAVAGIFIMRFAFYMMHLTVGLGVL